MSTRKRLFVPLFVLYHFQDQSYNYFNIYTTTKTKTLLTLNIDLANPTNPINLEYKHSPTKTVVQEIIFLCLYYDTHMCSHSNLPTWFLTIFSFRILCRHLFYIKKLGSIMGKKDKLKQKLYISSQCSMPLLLSVLNYQGDHFILIFHLILILFP